MNTKRRWTKDELDVLRQTYPRGGIRAVRGKLARSDAAITNKAMQLGLCIPGRTRPRDYEVTEFIDAAIRRGYEQADRKGDVTKLAKRLGRPRWWVTRRAAALGLVEPRMKEPDWSEAELQLLEATAHLTLQNARRRFVSAGFKRTETAIGLKRKRLQISRRDYATHYTGYEVARLLGVDHRTVRKWIDQGLLKAGRAGTRRQDRDEYAITHRAVRAFIVENMHSIDLRKIETAGSKYWLIDLLANRKAEAA